MLRSRKSHNPDRSHDPTPHDPPNPSDRYTTTDCIRLDMLDSDGDPVVVLLSRRAARDLANQLFRELCSPSGKVGAS